MNKPPANRSVTRPDPQKTLAAAHTCSSAEGLFVGSSNARSLSVNAARSSTSSVSPEKCQPRLKLAVLSRCQCLAALSSELSCRSNSASAAGIPTEEIREADHVGTWYRRLFPSQFTSINRGRVQFGLGATKALKAACRSMAVNSVCPDAGPTWVSSGLFCQELEGNFRNERPWPRK